MYLRQPAAHRRCGKARRQGRVPHQQGHAPPAAQLCAGGRLSVAQRRPGMGERPCRLPCLWSGPATQRRTVVRHRRMGEEHPRPGGGRALPHRLRRQPAGRLAAQGRQERRGATYRPAHVVPPGPRQRHGCLRRRPHVGLRRPGTDEGRPARVPLLLPDLSHTGQRTAALHRRAGLRCERRRTDGAPAHRARQGVALQSHHGMVRQHRTARQLCHRRGAPRPPAAAIGQRLRGIHRPHRQPHAPSLANLCGCALPRRCKPYRRP